jgi:hypothetical protein
MLKRRLSRPAILAVLLLSSCGGSAESGAEIPESTWDVVILTDSMGRYAGPSYAEHVEAANGVEVVLHNENQSGLTAAALLGQLQAEDDYFAERIQDRVSQAQVIVYAAQPGGLEPGGVDLNCGLQDGTFTQSTCDSGTFDAYQEALEQIAVQIKRQRDGRPTIIRAFDYFSPRISLWAEAGVCDVSLVCGGYHREAMRAAATAQGVPFAKVWDEFNGLDGTEDPVEKGYISADGTHPSDAGDQAIASVLHRLGHAPAP